MKKHKPRQPNGRWVYYILHEGLLWPCPVHWEWNDDYGGWLPYYFSPTLDLVVGDPLKAYRIAKSNRKIKSRKNSLG